MNHNTIASGGIFSDTFVQEQNSDNIELINLEYIKNHESSRIQNNHSDYYLNSKRSASNINYNGQNHHLVSLSDNSTSLKTTPTLEKNKRNLTNIEQVNVTNPFYYQVSSNSKNSTNKKSSETLEFSNNSLVVDYLKKPKLDFMNSNKNQHEALERDPSLEIYKISQSLEQMQVVIENFSSNVSMQLEKLGINKAINIESDDCIKNKLDLVYEKVGNFEESLKKSLREYNVTALSDQIKTDIKEDLKKAQLVNEQFQNYLENIRIQINSLKAEQKKEHRTHEKTLNKLDDMSKKQDQIIKSFESLKINHSKNTPPPRKQNLRRGKGTPKIQPALLDFNSGDNTSEDETSNSDNDLGILQANILQTARHRKELEQIPPKNK